MAGQTHQKQSSVPSTTTSERSRRPGGRTARTQQAVITAVLDELVDDSYDGLSLEGVAQRAGVHKTTVYRRWGTKERLVAEALALIADTQVQVPDTGHVDVDLQLLARSVATTLSSPQGAGVIRAMVDGAHRSAVVRGIVQEFWANRISQVGVIVDRAVERGQLPPGVEAALLIHHLGAPLYHDLLVTLGPLTEQAADRAAAAAVAAARAGVFTGRDSP